MSLYSRGDKGIYHFNGCCGHCPLKKSHNKFIKLQNKIRNDANQNEKRVRLGRWMQIHKLMIFNLASENQTYLYAAGRHAKDIGEKDEERCRQEMNYNFRTLCFSSENHFHFKRDLTKYSIKSEIMPSSNYILGRQSIKHLPQRLFLLKHEQGWWVLGCEVCERLTWKISSTCSRAAATAQNAAKAPAPTYPAYWPPSQAQSWPPALSCRSRWALCGLPGVFHFTTRQPIHESPKRSTSGMAKSSTPRHCGRQGVWGLRLAKDDGLVRAVLTKKG